MWIAWENSSSQIVFVQEERNFEACGDGGITVSSTNKDIPRRLILRILFLRKAGGWFSARIYDRKADLIESVDFRFLRALNDMIFLTRVKSIALHVLG